MPYDRFVALQLAGDELEPDDPEAVVATGFNRCYPDMVDLNDQGLRRQNALDDITETAGLAFLGLTIGCARCHDHKFDPISQADFYRLQAFFTPARFRDDYPILAAAARAEFEAKLAAWQAELAGRPGASPRDRGPRPGQARPRAAPGPRRPDHRRLGEGPGRPVAGGGRARLRGALEGQAGRAQGPRPGPRARGRGRSDPSALAELEPEATRDRPAPPPRPG